MSKVPKKEVVFRFKAQTYIDFMRRLKEEGYNRVRFIRAIVDGLISKDERILSFLSEHKEKLKKVTKKEKKISKMFEKNLNERNQYFLEDMEERFSLIDPELIKYEDLHE